jgi:hypothetical protein
VTDLTRYPISNDGAGRITLWYTDCPTPTPRIDLLPIWNEDDASEQVTELCLANLVAIAEEHEQLHHADEGPTTERLAGFDVADFEYSFAKLHRDAAPELKMTGTIKPSAESFMADYRAAHPECEFVLYRRAVGHWLPAPEPETP